MRIDTVVVNAFAKQRGLIVSVAEGLNRLRQAGLWLSEDVVRLLMKRAGE